MHADFNLASEILCTLAYLPGGGQGALSLTSSTGKISSIHLVEKGKIKERRKGETEKEGEKKKSEREGD